MKSNFKFLTVIIFLTALALTPLSQGYKITTITGPLENIKTSYTFGGKTQSTEVVARNLTNLGSNFFVGRVDPTHQWLAVSQGHYAKQFYARDTFISLMGGVYGDQELRKKFAYTLEWFSQHQDNEGYLPLWFRETDQLNTYWYCPFNRNAESQGIKQYDHLMQFIEGVWQIYSWENDAQWLERQMPSVRSAWNWLARQTEGGSLIKTKTSQYCGADWADQIRRGGYSTFVEVYWYKATRDLADLEAALGNSVEANSYSAYAQKIKKEINQKLWRVSQPYGYTGQPFGHYVGWIDDKGAHDYFEIDSNCAAIGWDVANQRQTKEIIGFVEGNFDHFVNRWGATRVVFGNYNQEDTAIEKNFSQNGGYWYLTSYFLSLALNKAEKPDLLNTLWENVGQATSTFQKEGLAEWYYEDGKIGGAPNYSWSLAYPVFLVNNSILGLKPSPDFLMIEPCLSSMIGKIERTFIYQGKTIKISVKARCHKRIAISKERVENGMLIEL